MTTIELLEESLKQLKIIQLDNLKREPNHPRNKFDYTVIVPDHPLGYHEHYTNDLKVAKESALVIMPPPSQIGSTQLSSFHIQ